jgi:hypothetical protein
MQAPYAHIYPCRYRSFIPSQFWRPGRLYLPLITHCVVAMPAHDSTEYLVHPERTSDGGSIHAEVRVLADDSAAAREPDAPRVKSEHPSCSCPTSGRNLVVCIDGTANQFSEKVDA